MNVHDRTAQAATSPLVKTDPTLPALEVIGRDGIAIRNAITFHGHAFGPDTLIDTSGCTMVPGVDCAVALREGVLRLERLTGIPTDPMILGGFHFAPGGNAPARAGGDDIPAINPCSMWDRNFRPACPDPRGMKLDELPGGRRFWCDIYMTGVDHLINGTSAFGVTIADGDDPPQKPGGKTRFKKFDYATACAVMAHHGKGLLSAEEFFAAAVGGTEQTACGEDPKVTGLDAARTSRSGMMQSFGSMWVWGHDGDPDNPRASMFGGSWVDGGYAGSRYAHVAYYWPDNSHDVIGARGRGDHLQLD
ncbi:MAG: hypothetical protein EPO23_03355 [Xanthobacteraceae bacterium]|nr:MAG: hypothetical protein EPO23_03355 [Xanthobacteraceae bacterium]